MANGSQKQARLIVSQVMEPIILDCVTLLISFKRSEGASHTGGAADYIFKGIPLDNYYCFGQSVFAPFDGEVISVKDNTLDGEMASWIHDQTTAIRHSLFLTQNEMVLKQSLVIMSSSNNLRGFMQPFAICKGINCRHRRRIHSTERLSR